MPLEKLQRISTELNKEHIKSKRIKYIKEHLFAEFSDLTKSELFFLIGFSEKWYYQNKKVLKNQKMREEVDFIIQFIECRLENELWNDASYGSKTALAKLIYSKSENKQIEISNTQNNEINEIILKKLRDANE